MGIRKKPNKQNKQMSLSRTDKNKFKYGFKIENIMITGLFFLQNFYVKSGILRTCTNLIRTTRRFIFKEILRLTIRKRVMLFGFIAKSSKINKHASKNIFCLFVCLKFIVPLENFSLIWRRHHCR